MEWDWKDWLAAISASACFAGAFLCFALAALYGGR